MKRWRYKRIDTVDALRNLDRYGRDGWELVGVVGHQAVFKKPKNEPLKEYARINMDIELINEMAEKGWEVVGVFQEHYVLLERTAARTL